MVRGEIEPEVTLTDGARAVEMGLAAQESARTGQAIDLSPVYSATTSNGWRPPLESTQ